MIDRIASPELITALEQTSREFAALVESSGAVRWADARAERLGIAPPGNLIDAAVPGCEDKARALAHRGCRDELTGWELPLVVAGKPVTAVFRARPWQGGAALLGSLIAQDYADAIAEGNRAVHEIVALNRELARQKARLEESNTAIHALHGELAQQADRMRAAAEVKGRLVAGVSHEFRTPLHSLDVMLDGEDTWQFLADVKDDPATADIPVLVCTVMNRESRARALGADEFWLKPVDEDRLITRIRDALRGAGIQDQRRGGEA